MAVSNSGDYKSSSKNLDWEDYKEVFFRFKPIPEIDLFLIQVIVYPFRVLFGLVILGFYKWLVWVEGK